MLKRNDIDLMAYKTVVYFTGDWYHPNGYYTVPTPLTSADMDRLTEYATNGGKIIAMGQDMAAVLAGTNADNRTPFYESVLGGLFWRDSVSGEALPSLPFGPAIFAMATEKYPMPHPMSETVMPSAMNGPRIVCGSCSHVRSGLSKVQASHQGQTFSSRERILARNFTTQLLHHEGHEEHEGRTYRVRCRHDSLRELRGSRSMRTAGPPPLPPFRRR